MLRSKLNIISITTLVWTVRLVTSTGQKECGFAFNFPSLNGTVLASEENTRISLRFNIDPICTAPDNYTITVEKMGTEHIEHTVCRIRHVNGQCLPQPPASVCSCPEESGMYRLTKVVDKSDGTMWMFGTDDGLHTQIYFVVSGPSQVSTLTGTSDQTQSTRGPPRQEHTTNGSIFETQTGSGITDETTLEKRGPRSTLLTTASPETETKSGDEDPQTIANSTSQHAPDVNILGSVGIVAVAATVITFMVIRARKGRRNRGIRPELRVDAVPDPDTQSEGRHEIPDYHMYFEVQDENMYPCSGAPVFRCRAPRELPQAPGESADAYLTPVSSHAATREPVFESAEAVPDAYLNPVASRAVKEGTDGAQNVIPLYGNSGSADGNTI